jgi:hypothetical protein
MPEAGRVERILVKVGQSFCLKTKEDWNQIRVTTVVDYRLFVQRDILLALPLVLALGLF